MHDSLLLLAAFLESPVRGTGQGLHGDKFPRVRKKGVGMKSKEKGPYLAGRYGP